MAKPFISHRWAMLVAASAIALASLSCAKPASDATSQASSQHGSESKPWTGDFDGMLERGNIRLLVPYSRSLFFVENGKEQGLTAELARDFETYLNQKHAQQLRGRKITLTLIPTTRDKLLTELTSGAGDIAGGNLTATSTRLQTADFVAPTDQAPANEVLVSGPGAPAVATLDDLSGKKVNVREASSYLESVNTFNDKLGAANKPAVQIVAMPAALEDEDVLEMLDAGLFHFTVIDSWKAKLWAQTVPRVKVHENIVLRSGGTIGWAIRKQSPNLQAEIEGFYKTASQQGLIESRLANYKERLREISTTSAGPGLRRFEQTLALFKQYGKQYAFDPLMLAAAGFQESQLNQTAAGVPSTQAPPAGGADFEKNVQAGTKYIDQLMTRSFPDAKFEDLDRTLFTFASYHAGADNIARMREEATKRGLDPNKWFNNVELVTAEKIGMETTAFVRNILKYNFAAKLMGGTKPA